MAKAPFAGSLPHARQRPPLTVEIWRGDMVESEHRVIAAIVDTCGDVVAGYGDVELVVYPRSAIKPLQAIPLLESGAADAYGLGSDAIALACASHNGESIHVDIARDWLGTLDLDPGAFACGSHMPYGEAAAHEMIVHDRAPSPLHNNCSGKHLGMLTTALHCGDALAGYEHRDHPVQQRIRRVLADLLDRDLDEAPTAVDGCSIPTIGVSMGEIAAMSAALLADHPEREARTLAARRIVDAMAKHPELIAGSGRFCSEIGRAAGGTVIVKSGAEGVAVALLRDAGIAIAVKVLDGARRAAEAATATLIQGYAKVSPIASEALARYATPAIENWRGIQTGAIRVNLPN